MAKLQIDLSGKGGLAPRFWGDYDRTVATPELRILGAPDQMADGIYNPLRRYGYMSPSTTGTKDLTFTGGTLGGTPTSTIFDAENNDFYFGERGQQLWKGDTLDDTELALAVDLGANNTIHDLEIYQINGSRKIFVIYDRFGYMDIAVSNLPYDSTTDSPNWLTNYSAAGTATSGANATGAFSNTLTNDAFIRTADNGFAYIFQDNNIHKIDGTTDGGISGTVSANVLQFPGYFQITDAIDYRGNMYVAIKQDQLSPYTILTPHTSNVGVYIWDRLTSIVRTRDYIPIQGVKGIRKIYVAPNGAIRIIALNSENIVQIMEFNGSVFKTIEQVGVNNAYPKYHDSLAVFSNFTIWLGFDGVIYAHGSTDIGGKEGIFKLNDLNITNLNAGAILFGGGNNDSYTTGFKSTRVGLYMGMREEGVDKIKMYDIYGTGGNGTISLSSTHQGDVFTLVKYLPQMSTINYVDIYMMQVRDPGTTKVADIKIYFNQSATEWATKTITRDDSIRGYVRIDIDKPYINSIQLEVEFNTSQTVGVFDFSPSMAIVDYQPTNTKG